MELAADPVLEEVFDPSILGKDQASLLNHVKGEYPDNDGDWAAGFITADPPPPVRSRKAVGKTVSGSRAEERERHNSWRAFEEQRGCSSESSGSQRYPEEAHGSASQLGRGPEGEVGLDEAREGFGNRSPYTWSQTGEKPQGSEPFWDESQSQGRAGKRPREPFRLPTERVNFEMRESAGCARSAEEYCIEISDDETEELSFKCSLCKDTWPLPLSYPMPNCTCLFCEFCMKKHVQTELEAMVAGLQDDKARGSSACAGVQGLDSADDRLECPGKNCGGTLSVLSCQSLAPEAFHRWEEAVSTALFGLDSKVFVRCPSCGVAIETVPSEPPPGVALSGVPELDRTAPYAELDDEGKPLSRHAMCHRLEHRYRCAVCTVDFCDSCRSAPYHLGRTCEEHRLASAAGRCRYCDQRLPGGGLSEAQKARVAVHDLRRELDGRKADVSWCVEKGDLWAVRKVAEAVCDARECRKLLRQACTRPLPCGHLCLGVRGERTCLPCLQDPCRASRPPGHASGGGELPSAEDFCAICWVEPLQRRPCVQLACGHVVHRECAEAQVLQGPPGPELSFAFLQCALCQEEMRHPSLDWCMRKGRKLKAQVEERALARLRADGALRGAPGPALARALRHYRFYECWRCREPYFGGERRCAAGGEGDGEAEGEAEGNGAPNGNSPPNGRRVVPRNDHHPVMSAFSRFFTGRKDGKPSKNGKGEGVPNGDVLQDGLPKRNANSKELICGGCVAKSVGNAKCLKEHGTAYMEYKCRFCCSVATYFCFGTTHFCSTCHAVRPDLHNFGLPTCRGGESCPLKVEHPPNGREFCLGCGLCRLQKG